MNTPVHLITENPALEKLVARLCDEPLIAVDTESNSLYAYYDRVCLIQLSTRETDYLIDPLAIDDMNPLGELFANPQIELVFHAAEYDIACMRRDFDYEFTTLFDTMAAARVLGYQQIGLSRLLEQHFGVQQDKAFQKADWGKRPLSAAQQRYAQMDTHYLPQLRDIMMEELMAHGAWDEALEIFAEIANTRPIVREFDPEGYWAIQQARNLTLRQMACLREIYLWRETVAERRNMPRFKIMSDEKMVDVVKATPQTLRDLTANRLLSPHNVQHYGRGILQALGRGQKAPLPTRPAIVRPDAETVSRHDSLKQWRKERALARGVESDVIIPRETLWTLAKRAPRTMEDLIEIEQLGPWRRAQYGEEILHVLSRHQR